MSQLFTVLRSGQPHSIATPTEPVKQELHWDLISFLATAQALKIDLLSIAWHPGLDRAGKGGTSEIQQLMVKSQDYLAFKRFEYSGDARTTERAIYQELISEILVLGHVALTHHPHIQPLLGICWHMRDDNRMWPVLVSEKAEHGNLHEFMTSPIGRDLPLPSKLSILIGVATALRDMHQSRQSYWSEPIAKISNIFGRYCSWGYQASEYTHREQRAKRICFECYRLRIRHHVCWANPSHGAFHTWLVSATQCRRRNI
jgi:hypothetical protein